MNDFTEQELQELQVEFASIEEEFAELGELFEIDDMEAAGASSDELSALDAELEGSGIGDFGGADTQSAGALTMQSIVEGNYSALDVEAQGIFDRIKKRLGGFLKRKVAKLIRKIVRLVRKYSKLRTCVPKVTKAVVSFKSGKFLRALREGHAAYRCIRKHT